MDEDQQYDNFVKVLTSGKQRTLVFSLDAKSTNVMFRNAYKIKETLPMPCFFRWIFLDFEDVKMDELLHFSASTMCWRSLYVMQRENLKSKEVRLSIIGPSMKHDGHCALTNRLGEWTSSQGLHVVHSPDKRIDDFRNRLLKVSFLDEHPFYARTKDGKGYEGMEYEILSTLKSKLNFRTEPVNNTDDEFGNRLANGTWTGFVGLIDQGHVIFSIATLSVSYRRLMSVDFSSPYIFGKMSFVVLSPALESRKYVLIKPLSPKVWIGLISTLILCTAVLYAITHSLPCKSGIRRAYNIWFLLRTLGQQGTPSPAPARYSIRFFISFWWFFIMVILWSYAGTLTSFMTYPGRLSTIDTVAKLQRALKSHSIRYGTTKGTTYETFLKSDMADVDPIFGESLEEYPESLVHNVSEGMDLVLKGRYAFVYMKMVLKWFAAVTGFDRFRLAKDVFSTEAIGIGIQKCHPCKNSFDHIIDRLEETGFFSKWYVDAFTKASIQAPLVKIENVRALSMDDLQGAFYFLSICLGICTTVLILEILISELFSINSKKQRNKKHYPKIK
ncbi:glutamate receptor-like [Stegodyphus dumicola]|uniref:glutamate receptor-like n=1 Tax=Stegodyphus dumicola TaxID=202533 RepID=UPI0015A7B054|nr:glutamate receptor-like [Stegodyphus dumicola]